jgi:hypothetical protein
MRRNDWILLANFVGMLTVALAACAPLWLVPVWEDRPTIAPSPLPYPTPTIEHAPTDSARLCVLALDYGETLRVRSGPGLEYAQVGTLRGGEFVPVIGAEWSSAGDLWYQIAQGWIAGWLVVCEG